MNCPVCSGIELRMTSREGVEIDYCPKCRGVWLDRGELDKIIERSMSEDDGPETGPGFAGSPHAAPSRSSRPSPSPGMQPAAPAAHHAPPAPPHPPQTYPQHPSGGAYPPRPGHGHDWNDDSKYGYPYKRKSVWKRMFDIID